MRNGFRSANRTKLLAFVFAALFVLGACAAPKIVTVTPETTENVDALGTSSPGTPGLPASIPGTPLPPTKTAIPATPTPVPPIASFEVDARSGTAPFTVRFKDATEGPARTFEWDFGDGITSTEASPVHEYTKAGTHTVRLTVFGSNGSDSETRTSYITVDPGVVVGLAIRPEHPVVEVDQTIEFDAVAVDQFGNGVPVNAEWSLDSTEGSLTEIGLFTAGTTAQTLTSVISATAMTDSGESKASASITVAPGPLKTVVIKRPAGSLGVQDKHQFSYEPADEYGNPITDAAATWTLATGLGSITPTGELQTGTEAGLFKDGIRVLVVSGQQRASASADLDIRPDVLDSVLVSPSMAIIHWQHEQQFTAMGADRFGNSIEGIAVTWEATGGEIDDTGLFVAGTHAGSFSVTATGFDGVSKSGSTNVQIPPPQFSLTQTLGDPEARWADGLMVFNKGVAVDSDGNIYVADRLNFRVQKFSPEGDFLAKWGRQGDNPGEFRALWGLAVDADGNVYTTEQNNNRIQKFTSDGQFLMIIGSEGEGNGQLRRPTGVAVSPNGDVYVADTMNDRIQRFGADGTFIQAWGSGGSGAGQFSQPNGIDIGPSGDVYVADTGNNRIKKYTKTGSLITFWGSSEDRVLFPSDVAVDADENVYVADGGFVTKFSSIGEPLRRWGGAGAAAGLFFWPESIAVGPSGDVYVSESLNHRVQRFSAGGSFKLQIGSDVSGPGSSRSPMAVAVAPDGNLLVADFWDAKILRFDPSGTFLSEFGEKGFEFQQLETPTNIAVDSFGNIYVDGSRGGDLGQGILKFDMSGGFITSWGREGTGPGEFLQIEGIGLDRRGRVYVVDPEINRIQVFTASGEFLHEWGSAGTGAGFFDQPNGIAIDADDSVYVTDWGNGRIQKFTTDGDFIAMWGEMGDSPGQFIGPADIALDHLGNVYVADASLGRVQMFTSDGEFLTGWGDEDVEPRNLTAPWGVAVDSSGHVYVADNRGGAVRVYTSPALTGPAS